MNCKDVHEMLGAPERTALKSDAAAPGNPTSSILQWIYTWKGTSEQASLRVDFESKGPEDWLVKRWEWTNR